MENELKKKIGYQNKRIFQIYMKESINYKDKFLNYNQRMENFRLQKLEKKEKLVKEPVICNKDLVGINQSK